MLVRDQGLPFATVLSIHHLADQGNFDTWDFALTNLAGRYFEPGGVEFFGRLNLLKGGILFADRIVVSSQPYAHQIQTPSLGEGLDMVLREHAHRLTGILGGADYRRWNAETDKLLPAPYGPNNLELKASSRNALLEQLQLAPVPRGPVFGMVTRLVGAKGFDILMPVLDRLLADDVRLVILGKGDRLTRPRSPSPRANMPTASAHQHDYDEALAHLIEGGKRHHSDPLPRWPGAFSAMHSLKYRRAPDRPGHPQIEQIIIDYDPSTDAGYGFLFYEYGSEPLWDAIKRAKEVFANRAEWERLMQHAIALDFSWALAAESYRTALWPARCAKGGRLTKVAAPRTDANSSFAQQWRRLKSVRPRSAL